MRTAAPGGPDKRDLHKLRVKVREAHEKLEKA